MKLLPVNTSILSLVHESASSTREIFSRNPEAIVSGFLRNVSDMQSDVAIATSLCISEKYKVSTKLFLVVLIFSDKILITIWSLQIFDTTKIVMSQQLYFNYS